MRTTIDIQDDILEEVMKRTGARSRKKAVEIAIKEYIRQKYLQELISRIDDSRELDLSLEDLQRMRDEK